MPFNAKKNDVKAFTEGAWVEIDGGQFRIARAGNAEYEKALEESGYRKAEDPVKRQQCLFQAISEGILKDWAEVVDANGEAIPFNRQNAVEVFEENPDLVNRILSEANDLSNYRRKDIEGQAKKPAGSSAGKGSGAEKDGA